VTTTVTKTINPAGGGGGYDYSSWNAWIADCPADLRAGSGTDQIWLGIGSGAISSAANILTVSGILQDATHYVHASAADLGVVTALRFDSANGHTISCTGSYVNIILNSSSFTRFSNLQIEGTDTSVFGARPPILDNVGAAGVLLIDKCILETEKTPCVDIYGSSQEINNSLCVVRGADRLVIANLKNGAQATNTAFVVPSDKTPATTAFFGSYATAILKNCPIFGVVALSTGTAPTYTTCFNDLGSPPSGVTQVTYDTSLFNNITNATRDFRIPIGSALRDAGTTDVPNAGTDIVGKTRASGTFDVGPWEYPDDVTVDVVGARIVASGGLFLWPTIGAFGERDIVLLPPVSSSIISMEVPVPSLPVPVTIIAMGTPEADNSIIDLYPPGTVPLVDVAVSLTGLSVTVGQGAFAFDIAQALTGMSVTATGGVLVPSTAVTLTGMSATATGGVLVPSTAVTLVGQAATASQGVMVPALALAFTGQAATATGGVLVPATAVALLGQAATVSKGDLTVELAIPMVGQVATTGQGVFSFSGNVDQALTGMAATVSGGLLVPEVSGVLVGQSASATGGTMVPSLVVPLVGMSALTTGGVLVPNLSTSLVGMVATTGQGVFVFGVVGALVGQSISVAQGALSPALAIPLVGRSITITRGAFSFAGDMIVNVTGVFATGLVGPVVTLGAAREYDLWVNTTVLDLVVVVSPQEAFAILASTDSTVVTLSDEAYVSGAVPDLVA